MAAKFIQPWGGSHLPGTARIIPSPATSAGCWRLTGSSNQPRIRNPAEKRSIFTGPRKRALQCALSSKPTRAPVKNCMIESPNGRSRCVDSTALARYSTEAGDVQPIVHDVFEKITGTWQYIVVDPSTSAAAIIDPVLDYDPLTQNITTQSADSLLSIAKEKGYRIDMILETHVHADHITAASYIQNKLQQSQRHKPPIGIGKRIGQVQKLFGERYGVGKEEQERAFDKLFEDDEIFSVGNLKVTAIHLPGHTPDHLGYKIGDNVFCGDSIFHADIGSARCDFPGGSADDLFQSGRKLLDLADRVKIWTGHDYPPDARGNPIPWMTVHDHKMQNKHLKEGISRAEFVALRQERDMNLAEPKLLHQSLQINIRAGRLPMRTDLGYRMLHLPLKLNGHSW